MFTSELIQDLARIRAEVLTDIDRTRQRMSPEAHKMTLISRVWDGWGCTVGGGPTRVSVKMEASIHQIQGGK